VRSCTEQAATLAAKPASTMIELMGFMVISF
jgi:hypothetical protein